MDATDLQQLRILRLPEVLFLTGLSQASLYRYCKANRFPVQVRLGPNRVGWRASEVREWLETRRRAAVSAGAEDE